uniref:U104-Liphistoxin-Lth1a_1 n=1 Tax=Liphistius thaleban TaxID=1905330 RepID=A0A4Q8K3K0_9ARAC
MSSFRGVLFYVIVSVCVAGTDDKDCKNKIDAEAYLETVTELVNKVKEHFPKDGNCRCPPKPMDCSEILSCGKNETGIYEIWPRNRIMTGSVNAFCDMETDEGGWTVLQRRGNYGRPIDYFNKKWKSYKFGFGDPKRDFWIGNDIIYALTNQDKYYLRIDMTDAENTSRAAVYDQFWIEDESQQYRLQIHDYGGGEAGDSLIEWHGGQKFSTKDRDNDISSDNCAQNFTGGWWYSDCHTSNLNGFYVSEKRRNYDNGIVWSSWKGYHEFLKKTEMKIRPASFKSTESSLNLNVDPQ